MELKYNIILQDRDIELLEELGRYGVIYIQDVKEKIYCCSKYSGTRLRQLEDNSFIVRSNKRIVRLAINGVNYLREKGIEPKSVNSDYEYRKKLAEIYHLNKELYCFNIETCSQVRENALDELAAKRYRFLARATGANNRKFWIYRLKKMKASTRQDIITRLVRGKMLDIASIKRDIKERVQEFPEDRNVIILCEDSEVLNLYKQDTTILDLDSEIAIEYTEENINYLNDVIAPGLDLNNNVELILPRVSTYNVAEKRASNMIDFKLTKDGIDYVGINLTNLDLMKEKIVDENKDFYSDKSKMAIICYEGAEQYFKDKYNEFTIISLGTPLTMRNW